MIEPVGSTNILYRFMNASVSLHMLSNVCELYCIQAAVTKLLHQRANGLIDVKRIKLGYVKTPGYDLGQLSPTR